MDDATPAAPPPTKPGNRRVGILAGGLVLVLGIVALQRVIAPDVEAIALSQNREAMVARRAALFAKAEYDETTFERLAEPKPGEWLWTYPEGGQTRPEFSALFDLRRLRGPEATVIVFQPLGPLSARAKAALEPIRAFTAAFFQREVRIAPELALPQDCYLADRGQYDADRLLTWLAPQRPPDALVYAAIADKDLMVTELNFVFGLGRLGQGFGIYSLVRFQEDADDALYLRRAVGLLDHEIGHGFGFKHCPYYRCSMNGQNSLTELDRTPKLLGPVCLDKLQHALGFEVVPRYRALAETCRRLGLSAEADLATRRAEHLTQAGRAAWWDR